MKRHQGLLLLTLFLLAPAIALADDAPSASPTSGDELHLLFAQGKYAELLQDLRVALSPSQKPPADQVDLLKLKGEALLRTKDDSGAADAFAAAARASKSNEEASVLRATAVLLKQSHQEMYLPKTGDKGTPSASSTAGIDIVEQSSRKRAFAALLQDELTDKSKQIDAAKKATTLPPIMSIAPAVGQIADLEQAANGSSDKAKEMSKSLGDRSRELITSAITKMGNQIDQMTKKLAQTQSGNRTQTNNHGHTHNIRRVKTTLTPDDVSQLKQIASTCDEISAACASLGKALGPGGGDFAATSKSAEELKKRASETARRDGPNTGGISN